MSYPNLYKNRKISWRKEHEQSCHRGSVAGVILGDLRKCRHGKIFIAEKSYGGLYWHELYFWDGFRDWFVSRKLLKRQERKQEFARRTS